MTQIEILRNNLIDKLQNIKNESLLKAVETILSQVEETEPVYELSESQMNDLKESEEQIKNGQTFENKEVLNHARQWLTEK